MFHSIYLSEHWLCSHGPKRSDWAVTKWFKSTYPPTYLEETMVLSRLFCNPHQASSVWKDGALLFIKDGLVLSSDLPISPYPKRFLFSSVRCFKGTTELYVHSVCQLTQIFIGHFHCSRHCARWERKCKWIWARRRMLSRKVKRKQGSHQ